MSNDELINLEAGDDPFPYIQGSYGLLGIIVKILLFVLLISQRKTEAFRSNYYTLVKIDLILNIIVYANTWPGYRMRNNASLVAMLKSLDPGYLTFFRSLFNLFYPLQFCTSFVLSAFRFAILTKFNAEEKQTWWIRLWYGAFFTICPGIFYTARTFYGDTSTALIINGTLYSVNHKDKLQGYVATSAIESGIYLISYIVIWTKIFVKWRKYRKNNQLGSISNDYLHKRLLRSVTINSLVSCVSFCTFIGWSFTCLFAGNSSWLDSKMRLDTLMYASDIKTFSTPTCLLLADRNVHRYIKAKYNKFFKKEEEQPSPTRWATNRSITTIS